MSWNTYDRNNLGHPVERLQPRAGTTHVVTIPGTTFKMMLGEGYMQPVNGKTPKIEALLKQLARTTIPGIGKRRAKCAPVLMTLEEFQALTTTDKAA